MSRRSLQNKRLVFNELCFPRIHYFKTRLRRIYPRLQNILNFEFNHPDRGLRRMRFDDENLKLVGAEIEKGIEVECSATDITLLPDITDSDLAIKPVYCERARTKVKQQQPESALSKDSLENVTIIATQFKDLSETWGLIAEVDWINHAILAVFSDTKDSPQICSVVLEAAKRKQVEVLIITSHDKNTTECKTLVLPTPLESPSMSKSPSPDRTSLQKGEGLSARETGSTPRPPHRVRFPSRRAMSPMQDSPPDSHARALTSQLSSPSSSRPGSPIKTLISSSSAPATPSKKSKLYSHVSTTTLCRQESHESMEIDEGEHHRQHFQRERRNTSEVFSCQSSTGNKVNWNTDALRKAVSFKLEVQVVNLLERILSLLKNVKSRRDVRDKVAGVSTLDKLIFEVEGLVSQSITESGTKMKKEIENQQISPKLTEDIMRVNGVYGCGTLYDRLNVHIQVNEGDDKEAIQTDILKVVANYDYKETDYDVNVVKSKPTMYGRLVICSV